MVIKPPGPPAKGMRLRLQAAHPYAGANRIKLTGSVHAVDHLSSLSFTRAPRSRPHHTPALLPAPRMRAPRRPNRSKYTFRYYSFLFKSYSNLIGWIHNKTPINRIVNCETQKIREPLNNPVVAGASWLWAVCFVANARDTTSIAALCASQPIPNPGAPTHSGLFRGSLTPMRLRGNDERKLHHARRPVPGRKPAARCCITANAGAPCWQNRSQHKFRYSSFLSESAQVNWTEK